MNAPLLHRLEEKLPSMHDLRAFCKRLTPRQSPRVGAALGPYTVLDKLGKGGFGKVYRVGEADHVYAAKVERRDAKHASLFREALVMKDLAKRGKEVKHMRVPRLERYFAEGDSKVLVMELLGKSLANRFVELANPGLSLKTVFMVAIQGLRRVEALHECGYVHDDIKPSNMLFGNDAEERTLYLVDFGLSRRFRDGLGRHKPRKEGSVFMGTVYFSSWRQHFGMATSRRDDLEALFYTLVFLATGKLPWSQKMDMKSVGKRKRDVGARHLCVGLPMQLRAMYVMISKLQYKQQPDYKGMRTLCREWLRNQGLKDDGKFDWIV